jgi:hypothetical protein
MVFISMLLTWVHAPTDLSVDLMRPDAVSCVS